MIELFKLQFFDYLKKFMNELKKTSSEYKCVIEENYKEDEHDKYISEIKENLFKYKNDFLGKDTEVDKLFIDNDIIFINNINLSTIWKQCDSDNKSAIIQYIKVFIFILESSDNKENENKTEKNTEFEDLLKNSLLDNENNLKSFCKNLNTDGDNSIVNMAKSIAEDLKTNNNINDNNISDLMGNNGQGLGQLINTITQKIDNEIKTGNVDHNKLFQDAQGLMGQFGGQGGNMPNDLFGNLFKGLNLNQAQNATQNTPSESSNNNVQTSNKKTKTKKKNK